jgi:hypothetical protein
MRDLDEDIDDRGCQPFGGFVHHDQGRVQQECPADGEHLLLPAGQVRSTVVATLGEPREQLVDRVGRPSPAPSSPGQHGEVLVDGERWKEPSSLGDIGDPGDGDLLGSEPVDPPASQPDLAARRREEADQRVAQRGLAHPVAPDDGDRLDPHAEAQTIEDQGRSIPGAQVAHLEQRVVRCHAASVPR